MYTALSAGAIGVHAGDLQNAIRLAAQHGFGGVEFNPSEVATLIDQHGVAYVKDLFAAANVRPAGFGLPTDWRGTEEKWRAELTALPRMAKAAAAIGCARTATWIMPCSNDRDWEENLAFHVERFLPIARVLAHEGVHLGLEFIGPKTLRESQKYPFVHTMAQMLDMAEQIGPNVGLLLDCWHWHTSYGTVDELHNLTAEQVVYVHVNDAPAGVPTDEQVDSVRALPGETGVIDIIGFLQALQTLGYDGPVVAEPFSKVLPTLPSDAERLQTVSTALDTILQKAGLS
jgi:sugar phosphate isomerase/epimerase